MSICRRAAIAGLMMVSGACHASDITADADDVVAAISKLQKDAMCLMINASVMREKSLFLAGLIASRQLEDVPGAVTRTMEPLAMDGQMLRFNVQLMRKKLAIWGVDLGKVDATIEPLLAKELAEDLNMRENISGVQTAGRYLIMLANKQRACKEHINALGMRPS